MCGIAGIINLDKSLSHLAMPIHQMANRMKHRGPDDEGFLLSDWKDLTVYSGDDTPIGNSETYGINFYPKEVIKNAYNKKSNIAFGHRRLSIIDLTLNGHQPMCDQSERYWIVFNGEIYNYKEIYQELKSSGYNVRGTSDTEVLLHAYIRWGKEALQKFNGMFAFAIYDSKEHTVFFARDRIGIKPLYYTIQNNQFIFASDIKTIIASGLYLPEVDWEGLWHNFSFSITPRPMTSFKNVLALEQAQWMEIDLVSGRITKDKYWKIPIGTQDFSLSEDNATQMLEEALILSIKYRLIADVEVGTFMSGGIDSTTISAIASKLHPGIKAFTLGFEKSISEFDEVEQAKAVAKLNNMDHLVTTIRETDVIDYIDDIVLGYEEPGRSLSPNFFISKIANNNNTKVVLNGLGGDELFAGYNHFSNLPKWKILKKFKYLSKLIPNGFCDKVDNIKKFMTTKTIDEYYTNTYMLYSDKEKERIFNKCFDSLHIISKLYNHDGKIFTDDIEALSYFDLMHYVGNHHVYRTDQFTMNFSIESRFPFLDHRFIETVFKIPSKYKLKNNVPKYILCQVAKNHIDKSCLSMKKKVFGLPVARWLKKELKEVARTSISELLQRNIFNNNEINRIIKSKNCNKIWQLVMFEKWYEIMIEQRKK